MSTNSTIRILEVMADCIRAKSVESERDFCMKIGLNPSNLPKIKKGDIGFTVDQIISVCQLFGTNANWVFGFEANRLRKEPKDPREQLKEIAAALENWAPKARNSR